MTASPKLYHYQQNQMMKLSHTNRLLFIRLALLCSIGSVSSITIGCSTNSWLYTSEWLKYYEPENGTVNETLPEYLLPHYYKNATLGPWIWCWTDPRTPFNCFSVEHLQFDESSDTTTSVEISVRKSAPVAVLAAVLVSLSLMATIICTIKHRSYRLVLGAGVSQIFTGMASLLCLVMYVHSVTKEVGKKLWPETPMDEPLFMYNYGYSFYCVVISYLWTETAAFFILFVYMAKHDEQMYNRYKIRSLFKSNVLGGLGGLSSSVLTTKQTGRGRRYRRISSKSMEKLPFNTVTVETIEEDDESKQHNSKHDRGSIPNVHAQQKLFVTNAIFQGDQASRGSSFLAPNSESPSWCGGSSVMSLTTAI